MTETKMSDKLKQLFPEMMLQNIETSTGFGVPDIVYGYKNVQGWIELKKIDDRVPKYSFTVPWRPGQLAWYHAYRKKCNMPYFLIMTIKDSWYIITDIKQKYSVSEIESFYIAETNKLNKNKERIKEILCC